MRQADNISFQQAPITGAPKLINSDLFLEKRATVPIKTQGVQRSSSGKKCPRFETKAISS